MSGARAACARVALTLCVALAAACGSKTPPSPPYAKPRPVDDAQRALHIQRTMRALADSTLARPRTVKVLFYGQSITREPWTRRLTESLHERFPAADLVVENKAIGGFSAELLVRTARADVLTFNPDLIILHDLFHVPSQLDALMRELVSLSTAEIIVQTTHIRGQGVRATMREDSTSAEYRRVTAELGLQLVDVRLHWSRYLSDEGLHPMALLRDPGGHLNAAGDALMFELLARELVVRDGPPPETKGVGAALHVVFDDAGRAHIPFDGSRVEADVSGAVDAAPLRVLVDGVAPSTMRDAWVHGRVGTALCTDWPWDCAAVIRVDHTTPLVDEEWTLTLRNVLPDGSSFVFDLKGSVTGPDGTGVSDRDFLSDSGRVQIAAADWWLAESYKLFGRKFPATVVMKWRPIALHANAVRPRADRQRVVLVAGVENRPHTLTLERAGEGPLPFVTLTVYKPAR